jgi:hypothetical protein
MKTQDRHSLMSGFIPGDIVETKSGNFGVVVKANTVLDGRVFEWNDLDGVSNAEEKEVVWQYALDSLPGFPKLEKHSWWTDEEFKRLLHSGPAHKLVLYRWLKHSIERASGG